MVRPPDSWDRLTAAVAISDTSKPEQTGAFLIYLGLVSGGPSQQRHLERIVRSVMDGYEPGPPGSSTGYELVAASIRSQGLAEGDSARADPRGELAKEGWARFLGSREDPQAGPPSG